MSMKKSKSSVTPLNKFELIPNPNSIWKERKYFKNSLMNYWNRNSAMGETKLKLLGLRGRCQHPFFPFSTILDRSRLITRAESQQDIHGVKISRGGPLISHLMFADDLAIFCKATESEAIAITKT
ncbi:hypothetical protein M9H77_31964 [Catharanthus roseus]|uniref:Uncharacterized protein n=1 Tax=Catharanthus roseus TaxID=4058 RepID=A0ACC0A1K4_CATRO|nr:hypothetical protein M9H77_31964 [Catharanthus roseus]